MSLRDKVIIVDRDDNVIKVEDKIKAHQNGELHRAFSVMLYRYNDNNELEFLLQQRANNKYHCPGLWANTVCSHPQLDEDIKASALIRLKEELFDIDTNSIELIKVGSFIYKASFDNGLTEHEYDHVFVAEYKQTPKFVNTDEIDHLKWVTTAEVEFLLSTYSAQFTPWFEKVFAMCRDYIKWKITQVNQDSSLH